MIQGVPKVYLGKVTKYRDIWNWLSGLNKFLNSIRVLKAPPSPVSNRVKEGLCPCVFVCVTEFKAEDLGREAVGLTTINTHSPLQGLGIRSAEGS